MNSLQSSSNMVHVSSILSSYMYVSKINPGGLNRAVKIAWFKMVFKNNIFVNGDALTKYP